MPLALETVRAALAARYRVHDLIDRGGMAYVYAAVDERSGSDVAIKLLRPEFAVTILSERFHREIEFLSTLPHPNIQPMLDSGEASGFVYYVMPLARDGTLEQRLRRERRLSLEETIEVTQALAAAIDFAHSHNVVHRDIKPGNVLFDEGNVRLGDFGVARALVTAGGERLSTSGLVPGTPEYMSPEQAKGSMDVGPPSDIYSLGCLAFQMLTGEPPFTGATPQAIFARQIKEPPPSALVVRPDLPDEVDRALKKALAKRPRKRCPTARLFAALLAGTAH
jgi:serine/threonine-protein kinase